MPPSHPSVCESIERRAWSDLVQAMGHRCDAATAWHEHVLRLRSRTIRSPLCNRALGLSCGSTPELVDDVVEAYRRDEIVRYFVHVPTEAEAEPLRERARALGLIRHARGWVKLLRDRASNVPSVPPAVRLVPCPTDLAREFGRILAQGFDLGDDGHAVFESIVDRPHWTATLAYIDDVPVAAGALFVADQVGYLAGGSTLPSHRRRGAQAALVAGRVAAALDLGCRYIVSETGEAVAGEPQHSYRNLLRAGLGPVYTRDNWTLPGTR